VGEPDLERGRLGGWRRQTLLLRLEGDVPGPARNQHLEELEEVVLFGPQQDDAAVHGPLMIATADPPGSPRATRGCGPQGGVTRARWVATARSLTTLAFGSGSGWLVDDRVPQHADARDLHLEHVPRLEPHRRLALAAHSPRSPGGDDVARNQ